MSDGPRFLTPPRSDGPVSLETPAEWIKLVLLVLFVLLMIRSLWRLDMVRRLRPGLVVRKGKAGATCKWRRGRVKREGTLQRWQCLTCSVDAFSHDGKPPKDCKRDLRDVRL
ncbi:MAG: hypothetical protein AAFR73_02385 [Pseudomonadota bacterium]